MEDILYRYPIHLDFAGSGWRLRLQLPQRDGSSYSSRHLSHPGDFPNRKSAR